MQAWPQDIEILTTGDGSPTLAFRRDDGYVEKMHHQGGALSESLYIYGEAMALAPRPVRALSFGLGLGYNELITLARLLAEGTYHEDWRIWSFEAVPFLREGFADWARGKADSKLSEVHALVAAQIASKLDVNADRLKAITAQALDDGRLELRGSFPQDLGSASGCNLVYYDAYSNKMDPTLWSEEYFLTDLNNVLAPDCVLATYAVTGNLKRSLKLLGFCLLPKAGFHGKRESTLAIRQRVR